MIILFFTEKLGPSLETTEDVTSSLACGIYTCRVRWHDMILQRDSTSMILIVALEKPVVKKAHVFVCDELFWHRTVNLSFGRFCFWIEVAGKLWICNGVTTFCKLVSWNFHCVFFWSLMIGHLLRNGQPTELDCRVLVFWTIRRRSTDQRWCYGNEQWSETRPFNILYFSPRWAFAISAAPTSLTRPCVSFNPSNWYAQALFVKELIEFERTNGHPLPFQLREALLWSERTNTLFSWTRSCWEWLNSDTFVVACTHGHLSQEKDALMAECVCIMSWARPFRFSANSSLLEAIVFNVVTYPRKSVPPRCPVLYSGLFQRFPSSEESTGTPTAVRVPLVVIICCFLGDEKRTFYLKYSPSFCCAFCVTAPLDPGWDKMRC